MARRAAAGHRRPPRRDAADLPPHRRGAVHRRAGQGGVRHGDAGAGHQHAGPHGGAGAAGEVQRRTAPSADAGGVHAADRPGRPPRHRHRGPRRGAVATRRGPCRGGRAGVHPDVPAAQFVRAVLQHDDQPGAPDGTASRRTSCWSARSRSTRRTGRWSGWCVPSSAASSCCASSPANSAAADAPILEYVRLRAQIAERERAQSRASRLQRRQAANDALSSLRRGDIISITHGRRGGLAVVLEPDRDGDDPRPLVLTENRWAGRISSADYSGAAAPLGSMTLPKRVEHRQPRVRRDVGVGAAVRGGRAGGAADAKAAQRRAGRARRRPRSCATLRDEMRAPPRAPHRRPGGARCGSPSATCGSSGTTSSCAARSPRRPTRWRAPSTGSSVLLTERRYITDDGRRRLAGHRRRPAAGPDLHRERPAGGRVPARPACGTGSTPPSWPPRCRRWCTSPAAATGTAPPTVRDIPTGTAAPGAGRTRRLSDRAARRRAAASHQRSAASPTRASSPRSTAGPPPVIWPTALDASDVAGTGTPLPAGDFVRWCRQVLDLLDQVRNAAAADTALRATAKRAIDDIRRGVVAVDAG